MYGDVNEASYIAWQQQGLIMARMALLMDVQGCLDAISSADALAPILDPSTWIRKHDDMDRAKRLFVALLPLKEFAESLRDEIEERDRLARG